ncbi:MAG: cysteine hydrolase [Dehalococcoidia bacterium]|nr:MAG: cysteine hydrolase [Dehalococcoidia bacterium]
MSNVVLVIDMLRGFLEEGYPLYIGSEPRNIIPNIQDLLEQEVAGGSKIFFCCDNHDPEDLEFEMFPPHCIAGTVEAEIIPELTKYPGEIITKKRYSAFFKTKLEERLWHLQPSKVIICGVLTDICVMHSIADARNRDYHVEVPIDCVAALDNKTQQFALNHIEKVLGARLTKSKEDMRNG